MPAAPSERVKQERKSVSDDWPKDLPEGVHGVVRKGDVITHHIFENPDGTLRAVPVKKN